MKTKKKFSPILGAIGLGIVGGYSLVAFAYTVPGWTEPYNPIAYYSLTEISWTDSPSPFALKDLARNIGNVYDYTRHIKSMIFGEKFEETAETEENQSQNETMNMTSFSEKIFSETAESLSIIDLGTKKVLRIVSIDETNPYLRKGNEDDWESYNPNAYNRQEKYKWLSGTYRNFAEGARQEVEEMEKSINAAKKIFQHTNIADGEMQMYQAQNELKTLLAYELARQNALDSSFAQMQAVYQASEYDENVESAYIDLITKFDVPDPYDGVTSQMLKKEYEYEKPELVGMPDFK